MRAVGDSVIDSNGVPGIVSSPPMYPAGTESYLVRQDGERAISEMIHAATDLQDGPAMPEYEPGDKVRLYGSEATITARNGDLYAATIIITRPSGVVFNHRYTAVPAWHIAIEKELGNA